MGGNSVVESLHNKVTHKIKLKLKTRIEFSWKKWYLSYHLKYLITWINEMFQKRVDNEKE